MFKDAACTEYADTAQEIVYCRINNPWVGIDSGWSVGEGQADMTHFAAGSPITEYPDDPYNCTLWADWGSDDSDTPFSSGQVLMMRNWIFDPNFDYGEVVNIFSKP